MTSEPLTEAGRALVAALTTDGPRIIGPGHWKREVARIEAEAATAERERIAPLVEAARQHVACICKGLVGDEPRPLGGGRVYHYQGCCANTDIAEALAEWEAHDDQGTE